MEIDRIDHLVLTVQNIEITCDFYAAVLGMQVVQFGNNRRALQFGKQKLNLHQKSNEFEPKARHPTPGAIDLCFTTSTPLAEVITHLQQCNVSIESGIVQRTGALGAIDSIYIRDPDGNLIELSNYR